MGRPEQRVRAPTRVRRDGADDRSIAGPAGVGRGLVVGGHAQRGQVGEAAEVEPARAGQRAEGEVEGLGQLQPLAQHRVAQVGERRPAVRRTDRRQRRHPLGQAQAAERVARIQATHAVGDQVHPPRVERIDGADQRLGPRRDGPDGRHPDDVHLAAERLQPLRHPAEVIMALPADLQAVEAQKAVAEDHRVPGMGPRPATVRPQKARPFPSQPEAEPEEPDRERAQQGRGEVTPRHGPRTVARSGGGPSGRPRGSRAGGPGGPVRASRTVVAGGLCGPAGRPASPQTRPLSSRCSDG